MLPRLLRMTASHDLDDDQWPDAVAEATEALELCDEIGQSAHRPERADPRPPSRPRLACGKCFSCVTSSYSQR